MNEIAPQLDDVLILGVKSFDIRIRQLVQNMRGLKLQLQAPDESPMYSSAEQSLFLQRGRTEVEYLNGEVVSLGKVVGLGLLKKCALVHSLHKVPDAPLLFEAARPLHRREKEYD